MTNQHTIIPPRELVRQWMYESNHNEQIIPQVADFAAQWGADQELEASLEWLVQEAYIDAPCRLRAARRPNPPSLKEQALKALTAINSNFHVHEPDADIIRRALEQLND